MSLFSNGKRFLASHPRMLRLAAVGYNFVAGNRIRGKRGNSVRIGQSFLRKCKITIKGKNNQIVLGKKCYLNHCSIQITGNNNTVVFGDIVCIHEASICIEDNNNRISIGDKTLICGPSHLACIESTSIEFGKGCLLSSETVFRTGDSHSVLDMSGIRVNPSKNIILGDRVWVGHRAMCTKGAELSNDSIISTGAIVTKPFNTPNVIVGVGTCGSNKGEYTMVP